MSPRFRPGADHLTGSTVDSDSLSPDEPEPVGPEDGHRRCVPAPTSNVAVPNRGPTDDATGVVAPVTTAGATRIDEMPSSGNAGSGVRH